MLTRFEEKVFQAVEKTGDDHLAFVNKTYALRVSKKFFTGAQRLGDLWFDRIFFPAKPKNSTTAFAVIFCPRPLKLT